MDAINLPRAARTIAPFMASSSTCPANAFTHSQRRPDSAVLHQRGVERRSLAVRFLDGRPDRRARLSADALFPYITVDKIHESTTPHRQPHAVPRPRGRGFELWEPFNREQVGRFRITRNLYKNTLGNKLCFEEINHDLGWRFATPG
jgi:hypothetical protein